MWVTKLLISPVKKRIFCPKTTKFGPKLAFLVNLGQAMQAYSVPCWWVGWWLWRAGCISQDTYLLYNITISFPSSSVTESWVAVNDIGRVRLQSGSSQKSESSVSDLLTLFLNYEKFKCTICVLRVRQCFPVLY